MTGGGWGSRCHILDSLTRQISFVFTLLHIRGSKKLPYPRFEVEGGTKLDVDSNQTEIDMFQKQSHFQRNLM